MQEINQILIIITITVALIKAGRLPIAGNFNPFLDETHLELADESTAQNESQPDSNMPSLDIIHDHVHHSLDTNITDSVNDTNLVGQVGPSLDLIDSHSHDDDNTSFVESAKRFLMQPSFNFLDAKLHGGDEHVHDINKTDSQAADLNDYYRWLKEQNETNRLSRFMLLQKEINRFHFIDEKDLNEKLNRTIEELKVTVKRKQRSEHDL